jgi:twinkle protein
MAGSLIQDVEVKGLRTRKITDETCKHFGYGIGTFKDQDVQVAPYYDADGKLVAQKIRFQDKDFKVLGSLENALPFGAHAFQKTGKHLTVTEGEIDAMSVSQVQGNAWPVVSIACGAGAQIKKYMAKHLEYFSGFDRVVLMFDMDEPGRKAAKAAAEILGARAAIAELSLKDANEMLVDGRGDDIIQAFWRAKQYRPEGIVDMASLKDEVKKKPEEGISWWSPKLTSLTYGIRLGEILCFGAGTGVGKTDLFTQQMAHMVMEHGEPIGVFALEQQVADTAKRIAGKFAKKTFHIPDSGWTEEDLDAAWKKFEGKKVFLYDSFGVNEWESIREKIEYLNLTEGVRFFFLDHLTALADAGDSERESLERIMGDMGSLVARRKITIFLVSHLATPDGKPHEEGGRVTIRHLKGSRAIGFWAHYIIGLERDQQAEDEVVRTTTTVRILKDRYTGRATGRVFHIGYDFATGMLFETTDPEERKPETHGFQHKEEAEGVPSDF